MKKESKGGPITSHMGPMISSLKEGKAKVQSEYPHKLTAGEVSNEVPRPAKK